MVWGQRGEATNTPYAYFDTTKTYYLNHMEPEEIARQNVLKTGMQIREICKDKELLDFFRSCVEQTKDE